MDFDSSLCNKKIIGARSFSRGFHASSLVDHLSDDANPSQHKHNPKEFESARDRDGHGTHTASTSVGSPVANASLLGYAPGTARGMETGARVAAYKVCWVSGCSGSDILAGIDKAISDGVDILSLSLGGGAVPYYYDTIASEHSPPCNVGFSLLVQLETVGLKWARWPTLHLGSRPSGPEPSTEISRHTLLSVMG